MPLLDKISQLKSQGYDDIELSRILREQGSSPKEISDALAQYKVKLAVNDSDSSETQDAQMQNIASGIENSQQMQPSMLDTPSEQQYPEAQYAEQTQPQQETQQYAQQTQQMVPQEQQYSPQYPQQYSDYQPYQTGINSETINEIAEQAVDEKLAPITKKLSSMSEFKSQAQSQIEDLSSRLKKIEAALEKLQYALLNKISSYSEDMSALSSELKATQSAFSKMLNPILDKRDLTKMPHQNSSNNSHQNTNPNPNAPSKTGQNSQQHNQQQKRAKSAKPSFEDYLA